MWLLFCYLNQQDDKLCDDVSQHDLGGGHSGHPASIQKSFLPLDDEWEGSLKKQTFIEIFWPHGLVLLYSKGNYWIIDLLNRSKFLHVKAIF